MANAATTPVNDLGNWTVGQLLPAWEFPLTRTDANGNVTRAMDLTGVTTGQLSLIIYNSTKTQQIGTGQGAFVISNSKPGVVTYTQKTGSSDIATAGTLYFRVEVNFNGTSPDYSDYVHIQVSP